MQDLHGLAATLRAGGVMIYPLLALAIVAVVVALEKGFVFFPHRLPASLLAVARRGFDQDDLERGGLDGARTTSAFAGSSSRMN
jgi:hypothetical protein